MLTESPAPVILHAHLMDYTTTAGEDIKVLLRNSTTPLKSIAHNAGVPYDAVQKWMAGTQKTITLDIAEKLWFHLTGEAFTR